MDTLQELVDERVLVQLWQVGQQLREATGRLERLTTQSQECLSKAEAQEVRLDVTRASFETLEQRMQAISARVERALGAVIIPSSAKLRNCSSCEALQSSAETLTIRMETQAKALDELREQFYLTRSSSSSSRPCTRPCTPRDSLAGLALPEPTSPSAKHMLPFAAHSPQLAALPPTASQPRASANFAELAELAELAAAADPVIEAGG